MGLFDPKDISQASAEKPIREAIESQTGIPDLPSRSSGTQSDPAAAPHGNLFTKILDLPSHLTQYPLANVVDWYLGGSEFSSPQEAALAGLTGKSHKEFVYIANRYLPENVSHMPLPTGNMNVPYVPLGMVGGIGADYASDITTWLPWNALTKIVNATKAPQLIGKAAIAAGNKAPFLGKAAGAVKSGFIQAFVNPMAASKAYAKIEALEQGVKAAGISDDIIEGIHKGTTKFDDVAKMAEEAESNARKIGIEQRIINAAKRGNVSEKVLSKLTEPEVGALKALQTANELKTITGFYETQEILLKIPREVAAQRYEIMMSHRDYVRFMEKVPIKDRNAWNTLWESALPVPKNGHWGFSDDFYNAAKRFGVTDTELADIQSRVMKVQVEYLSPQEMAKFQELGDMVDNVRVRPKAWEIPEYQEVMDSVIGRLNPEYRKVYETALLVKKEIVKVGQEKQLLVEETIRGFAKDTGLNHLLHMRTDQAIKKIKEYGLQIRATYEDKLRYAIKEVESELYAAGMKEPDIRKKLSALNRIAIGLEEHKARSVLGWEKTIDKSVKQLGDIARATPGTSGQLRAAIGKYSSVVDEINKRRNIMGTVEEINALVGESVFETNFSQIIMAEHVRMAEAVAMHDAIDKIIQFSPKLIKRVSKTPDIVPAGFAFVEDKLVGKFVVHKDLIPAFEASINYVRGDKGVVQGFANIWDKTTQALQYSVTVPFPKFFIRNFGSAVLINGTVGMEVADPRNARYYPGAVATLIGKDSGNPKHIKEYAELIREGITQRGFHYAEATKFGQSGAIGWLKKLPGMRQTGTKYLNVAEKLTEYGDDIPRIALYRWLKDHPKQVAKLRSLGKTPAEIVRKVQPGYVKATPFERAVMKRAFFFYSWPRYNLPLNMELLFRNPKYYVGVDEIRKGINRERMGPHTPDYVPEFIKQGYPINWDKDGKKERYWVLRGWYAPSDLQSVMSFSQFSDMVVQSVNPMLKTPAEIATNYDTFTKKKISEYPGETKEILGQDVPARLAHLARPLRLINEIDRFFFPKKGETASDRIYQAIFGKLYIVDDEKAKHYVAYTLKKQKAAMEKDLAQEKKDEDWGAVKTLKHRIRELEREIDKLE